jgi:hypothetical protein
VCSKGQYIRIGCNRCVTGFLKLQVGAQEAMLCSRVHKDSREDTRCSR